MRTRAVIPALTAALLIALGAGLWAASSRRVSSAGRDGKVAPSSNRGPWVGVLAPNCGAAIDARDRVDVSLCGTSAAAPFIAGLAGLLKSVRPGARGQDIIRAIQQSARPTAGSAHGLVDAARAVAVIRKMKLGRKGPTKSALLRIVRRPLISGTGAVGGRLTTSPGAWPGPITAIAIRWERCRRTGGGCHTVGKGATYTVIRADRGHGVRVVVSATGVDGIAVEAPSHLLLIRR